MRMVGRRVGVIAALVAVGLCAAACGGGSEPSGVAASFGRMAGYVWQGHVASVAAAWPVPRMAPGSGAAHASTWIAAQAPGPSRRSPFIQVGIVEDRADSSPPVYGAFWTDTTRGFHPQILFDVRPGDVVASALSLASGRWQVSIRDTTSGQHASFSTREEGQAAFGLAEWLQEDPSDISGNATPYPRLSTVRIGALAANGAPPRYADVFAQWMSLPDRNLAPTPLRRDAFSITRAVLSRAGQHYLQIARPQNAVARRLGLEEASWTASTSVGELRRISATAAVSERAYADGLDRAVWPATAQGPIATLVHAVRHEAVIFQAAARQAPSSLTAFRRRLAQVTSALLGLVHAVRRALHLPELVPGQALRSASTRTR